MIKRQLLHLTTIERPVALRDHLAGEADPGTRHKHRPCLQRAGRLEPVGKNLHAEVAFGVTQS